jgi:GYF domain 2
MAHSWFYRSSGQVSGPVDFDGLTQLAATGTLQPGDELRRDDQRDWVAAGSVVGLFPELEELADLADLNFQFVDSASAGVATAGQPDQLASLDDLDIQIVSETAAHRTDKSAAGSGPAATFPVGKPPTQDWYYQCRGEVEGPLSLDELVELAGEGLILPDDSVRRGESGAWQRAARVEELTAGFTRAETDDALPEDLPPGDEADPCDLDAVDGEPDLEHPPPAPPVDRWFCLIEDVEHGPLTWADLTAMAEHRRIKRETQVKQGDEGEWSAAGAVEGLFADAEAPADGAADSPAGTTAAVFDVPRPKKEKKRKPKRVRGPREPLVPRIKALIAGNKPVIFGGLGLAVIVAAVVFFAIGRSVPQEGYVNSMKEILDEHYALKKRKANHTEWKPLIAKAEALRSDIQPVLEKTASAKQPALQELLWASQDMVPMLEDRARTPNEHEVRFVVHLTNAAKMLKLPSDFRSGEPPAEPPAKSKKK